MEKPGKKICTQCGKEKPVVEFSLRKASKDGMHCWCKSCMANYRCRYYEENKEKIAASERRYREAIPEPYVKRMLGATPDAHIPPSLIEAKRFHLRIVRELRKD